MDPLPKWIGTLAPKASITDIPKNEDATEITIPIERFRVFRSVLSGLVDYIAEQQAKCAKP